MRKKTKHVDKTNEFVVEKGMEVDREERGNKTTEADQGEMSGKMEDETSTGLPDGKRSFPVSLRISRGPIAGPLLPEMITNSLPPGDFPANVTFVKVRLFCCMFVLLLFFIIINFHWTGMFCSKAQLNCCIKYA